MDDGDVKVVNRGWFWWFFFSYYSLEGKARAASNGNGELAVNFSIFSDERLSGDPNYKILSTDYSTYTLIYSCSSGWLGINEYVWMLGRNPTMDDSTKTQLKGVLGEQVPNYDFLTYLEDTVQGDNCIYE